MNKDELVAQEQIAQFLENEKEIIAKQTALVAQGRRRLRGIKFKPIVIGGAKQQMRRMRRKGEISARQQRILKKQVRRENKANAST